jgi:hypothetical protein
MIRTIELPFIPHDIAVAVDGSLYAVELGAPRVHKLDGDGKMIQSNPPAMIRPSTVAAAIVTQSSPHTPIAIPTTMKYPTGMARFAGHRNPTRSTPTAINGASANRLKTARFSNVSSFFA